MKIHTINFTLFEISFCFDIVKEIGIGAIFTWETSPNFQITILCFWFAMWFGKIK
jgi:hypothetical protein